MTKTLFIRAVALSLLACLVSTAGAVDYTYTVIADSNGVVAGDPTRAYADFPCRPAIRNNGEVVFYATYDAPYTSIKDVRASDGVSNRLVATNQSGAFSIFYYDPAINNNGQVAFCGYTSSQLAGIYSTDGTTVTVIASDAGDFGGYTTFASPSINDSGVVAFKGTPSSSSGLGPAGVFVGNGGPVTVIANLNNGFDSFTGKPVINNSGNVAVFGIGIGVGGIYRGNGGPLTTIANVSSPLFGGFNEPCMNDSDFAGFAASLDAGGWGVYSSDGTTTNTIMTTLATPYYSADKTSINNCGRVLFKGNLDTSGIIGLFRGPDPATDKVIQVGDALLGSTVTFLDIQSESINDADQVAFYAELANGVKAIVRADPPANQAPVCNANGPYAAVWSGTTASVELSSAGSSDPDADSFTYAWSTDCPGASFSSATAANPVLTLTTENPCPLTCNVTLTVTDCKGLASSPCTATVSVCDQTPPVVTAPDDVVVMQGEPTDPSETGTATATDTCDASPAVTYSDSVAPGACVDEQVITRTWTATDSCGNSASAVQTITVQENTPPVLTVPADVTVDCTAPTDPAATGEAAATDNCDPDPVVTFSDASAANPACPQGQIITRTWMATDARGNTAIADQTITVSDLTAPVVTAPANITVACGLPTDPAATGEATAADNCDPAPAVTYADTETAGSCPQDKVITRTWTATDACGNAASAVQTITVEDVVAPVLTVPANTTVECGQSTDPAATGQATASDNCDTAPVISYADSTAPDPSCPQEQVITRTWTATDACGNAVSQVQSIAVQDTTAPVLTVPANATVECGQPTDPSATGQATATDACDPAPTVTYSDSVAPDPTCPQQQVITRTWTATDACGNVGSGVQTITVADTTPPVLVVDTTPITVEDPDCTGSVPVTLPVATATDNCGPATVTNNGPATFPPGETIVTFTATDACGNTSTANLSVTVNSAGQAHILVKAYRYTFTLGLHPHMTKTPLVGINVCAYDRSYGTCAWTTCGGIGPWSYQCIVDNCTPAACGITDSNGHVTLDVPPGNYLTIGFDSTLQVLDHTIGAIAPHVDCGETVVNHLIQIVLASGKHLPGKCTRLTGSELLIIEPEYMIWDGEEQQYPFGFESEGDWNVTVAVAPPEGFVPDYPQLSETVASEQKAVQFTITEVGSDLLPTKTTFKVKHKGRLTTVRSNIGIKLTEKYAKARGFNTDLLKTQGLIFDKEVDMRPVTALPVADQAAPAVQPTTPVEPVSPAEQ